MKNFFKDHPVEHLTIDGTNYVLAAGTTDVKSGIVDAANCGGVSFLLTLGVMAAASTVDVKVQGSNTTVDADFVDLAGTAQTQAINTDDDKCIGVSIDRPTYRYLRLAITRGDAGNSTIEHLLAIKVAPRKKPYTQLVTAGQFIAQPELWVGPAAGTA